MLGAKTIYNYFRSNFSGYSVEKKRLFKIPRYHPGTTNILGNKLFFVDSITLINGLEEIFEKECYSFISEKSNPVIVDCGSNIGLSIIYFKRLYPGSEILGFEPDKIIFDTLKNNIGSFGLSGVTPVNAAIWNSEGMINFRSEGGFGGRIPFNNDKPAEKVNAVRLSNYINKNIDLLKIDIEGAELEVLIEIYPKLSMVDRLFIEYHSPAGQSQKLDKLLSLITGAGFRYYIKESFTAAHPFKRSEEMDGMDLLLNIYCLKKS